MKKLTAKQLEFLHEHDVTCGNDCDKNGLSRWTARTKSGTYLCGSCDWENGHCGNCTSPVVGQTTIWGLGIGKMKDVSTDCSKCPHTKKTIRLTKKQMHFYVRYRNKLEK